MRKGADVVAVVDFGARAIRVLIARRMPDGTIEVIGHGQAASNGCVSQGVIQDLAAAQSALGRALSDAEKEARTRVYSVFCGIHGKHVNTFIREATVDLEGEECRVEDMDEAFAAAAADLHQEGTRLTASLAAQEWHIDGLRVREPLGIRGQKLHTRIHFARMPSFFEDNLSHCIEMRGCDMEDMVFTPIASSLGCLTAEDMELGVAVLDMGRSSTGLAVYRDHSIQGTACFEWGAFHLTRDVAAGLQISFNEADDLVIEYGIGSEAVIEHEAALEGTTNRPVPFREEPSPRVKLRSAVPGARSIVERSELDSIIHDRAVELLTEARQHLKSTGLSQHLVRGVVLTGGASSLKNFVTLAETIFQVPCRRGEPIAVSHLPHAVQGPEWSAAVGIMRHAFDYRTAERHGRGEEGLGRKVQRVISKYFF